MSSNSCAADAELLYQSSSAEEEKEDPDEMYIFKPGQDKSANEWVKKTHSLEKKKQDIDRDIFEMSDEVTGRSIPSNILYTTLLNFYICIIV